MKPNLKLIFLCLGTGLATVPALRADDTPPPPPANQPPSPNQGHGWGGGKRGEKMLEHLAKALNLTADQQSKWQALGQQERDAVAALRSDASVPRDQKWAKMQDIRKNFQDQRRATLTSDQQTKFDELIAKMRERRERHASQDNPPPPPPAPPANGT
jgi:Spy/CpxP family protein refolding chaperone